MLDIGCGAGTNCLFLAKEGYRVSGIDLAPGAIDAARERARRAHLEVDFRVGDAVHLPFPQRTFGGVNDFGCFHTLPIRLRPGYCHEVARVLRPGARTCSRGWRENSRASGLALLIAHRSRRSRGSSSTTSSFDEPNTAIGVADFPSSTPPCSSAVPDPSRPPCRPFWPASRRTFSRSRGGGGCVYSTPRHVVQQATSATQHPQHRQQLVHWQQLQLKGLPEE